MSGSTGPLSAGLAHVNGGDRSARVFGFALGLEAVPQVALTSSLCSGNVQIDPGSLRAGPTLDAA
ncbi:hypothetical protein [Nonomuraea sp. NPDC049480]|uniref:hypothetical protein n=1 Tax=Nonomuraea sp. NPDC049480 TaxID=3364353 RepID=UPI00379E8884